MTPLRTGDRVRVLATRRRGYVTRIEYAKGGKRAIVYLYAVGERKFRVNELERV